MQSHNSTLGSIDYSVPIRAHEIKVTLINGSWVFIPVARMDFKPELAVSYQDGGGLQRGHSESFLHILKACGLLVRDTRQAFSQINMTGPMHMSQELSIPGLGWSHGADLGMLSETDLRQEKMRSWSTNSESRENGKIKSE